jgi:hypothetical protein
VLVGGSADFFPYTFTPGSAWDTFLGARTVSLRELGQVVLSFTGAFIDAVMF